MRQWTDITDWPDPLHRVMAAQAQNIMRIEAGLDLGPDVKGDDIILIGPTPEVVRLYDTPQRLHRMDRYANAERIVTIGPYHDKSGGDGRNSNKDGRTIEYGVACQITLTEAEQRMDVEEEGVDSPLARKAAAWAHDFRSVFNTNQHLIHAGCPTGLVDDAQYDIVWDPDTQYPSTLVIVQIRAILYA